MKKYLWFVSGIILTISIIGGCKKLDSAQLSDETLFNKTITFLKHR